jgi:hypothetical protein
MSIENIKKLNKRLDIWFDLMQEKERLKIIDYIFNVVYALTVPNKKKSLQNRFFLFCRVGDKMNGRYAKQFRKLQNSAKKQLEMQIKELSLLQRLRLAINILFKKRFEVKKGV